MEEKTIRVVEIETYKEIHDDDSNTITENHKLYVEPPRTHHCGQNFDFSFASKPAECKQKAAQLGIPAKCHFDEGQIRCTETSKNKSSHCVPESTKPKCSARMIFQTRI